MRAITISVALGCLKTASSVGASKPTEVVGDWYAGIIESSCTYKCQSLGMRCSEEKAHEAAMELGLTSCDSSNTLFKSLGRTGSFTCGEGNPIPNWNSAENDFLHPYNGVAYDCEEVFADAGNKTLACYCVE